MMSHRHWIVAVALLSCLLLATRSHEAFAQLVNLPAAAAGAPHGIAAVNEAKILAALDEPCRLEFIDTPLSDMAAFLADTFNINVRIDIRALEDIGLGTDTPISTQVNDISLRSALALILGPLDLTWSIHHEVLMITTTDIAYENITTRVYPVGDLVIPVDLSDAGPIVVSPSGPAGGPQADFDSLIELITSSVVPDLWDEAGGPGTVDGYESNGRYSLVISQPEQVHRQVAMLLDELRSVPVNSDDDQADTSAAAKKDSTAFYRVYPLREEVADSAEELVYLLRKVVEPQSWNDGAEITPLAETIVVKQTASVQNKVYRFLADLGAIKEPAPDNDTGRGGNIGDCCIGCLLGGGSGGGGFGGGGGGGGFFGVGVGGDAAAESSDDE